MASDLPDSEFYDVVGETFIFDPKLFMIKLYKDFMEKMEKMIGAQKRKEMERYIIEKYSLAEDEKIIYELKGNISYREDIERLSSGGDRTPVTFSINSADIFITNKRMIVNGKLKTEGGVKTSGFFYELTWLFPGLEVFRD